MQGSTTRLGWVAMAAWLLGVACGGDKPTTPPGASGGEGGESSATAGSGGESESGGTSTDGNAGVGNEEPGSGGGSTGQGGDTGDGGSGNGPSVPPGCDAPLDFTVATHFYDAVRCLFTGDDALQVGVEDGALQPARIAVVRGRIVDVNGQSLDQVTVTHLQDQRVGSTSSRSDGRYDMAVQGGGQVTLRFEKDGYLPVQRQQAVGWQEFVALGDTVLLQRAKTVTQISLARLAAPALVRGTSESDDSGARQQALLVAPGTTATLELNDGSSVPLDALDLRMVEYTVGASGPAAMPGNLPSTSAYTYAVELSIDQAEDPDVASVRFDPPLVGYVDNFLDFPAGTPVPLGFYEGKRDAWQASESGFVLDILDTADGLASLDTDGDGIEEAADELAAVGIDEPERAKLATEYEPGDSLWRIRLPHFSAWDCNWPFGPPLDALAPLLDVDVGDTDDCRTSVSGSIIGCEDQTLGEVVPLSGTPYSLRYQSERMPGRKDGRALNVRMNGADAPASAKRIDFEVEVLGVQSTQTLQVGTGNHFAYAWDGLDAWGRAWQGRQDVSVRVGYVYDGAYQNALRFGDVGDGVPITGDRSRQEITLWTEWHGKLGGLDQRATGFGGWSLDVQHLYDPRGRTLWLGSGQRRTAERIGNSIDTIAGGGPYGTLGDGGPATAAHISGPHGIVVAPDGSVFISDENNHRVRKVSPDGVITTYAGNGSAADAGDGGPALEASISQPLGLALSPAGLLYVSGRGGRVRVIDPATGTIQTAAGGGNPADGRGDGGPAVEAAFQEPHALAFTPDGSLLVADATEHTVRRIAPDGTISTLCGERNRPTSEGDGGPATAATLASPLGIAVAPDGSIFISEWDGHRVRKIDPTGVISTLAGTGQYGFAGDGGPASEAQLNSPHSVAVGPDGSVYITDEGNDRVRRVGSDGIIETIAGGGTSSDDGGSPLEARFGLPRVIYYHGDGSLWVADYGDSLVRRIKPGLPGFSTQDIVVAAGDASEVYVFDDHGRHLRTVDSLLGVTTRAFEYDARGLLKSVTDRDGNVTSFERDDDGAPVAVSGPFGERTELALAANGYLSRVTNAAGEVTRLEHDDEGLLTLLERPRNQQGGDVHHFNYDELGRLIEDQGPTGVVQALERSETATGHSVVVQQNGVRAVSYTVDAGSVPGQTTRTRLDAAGLATTSVQRRSTSTGQGPTSSESSTLTGDPRFGMLAPFPVTQRVDFSPMHSVTTRVSRTATLSDAANPLSVTALNDTVTVNSRASSRRWNSATRAWTFTSPEYRGATLTFDERGRPAASAFASLTPRLWSYDARGRVISSSVGNREYRYEYDTAGNLAAVVNPLQQTTAFTHDAVGRVRTITNPDGSSIELRSDAASALTSVKPPARPEHVFSYAPGGLLQAYTPPSPPGPSLDPTTYAYDEFADLASTSLPTGETVGYVYDDTTGRLASVELGGDPLEFIYDASTGQLSSVTRGADALTLSYSGSLATAVTWSGQVSGSVEMEYDPSLRLAAEYVGDSSVSFAYDRDSLLTGAGNQTFRRAAASGAVLSTELGLVGETFTRDAFGELTRHLVEAGPTTLYERQDTRDALGRVVEREEAVLGEDHVFTYEYDVRGRLIEVTRDGAVSSAYSYDDNGNRLTATIGETALDAGYDAQDRLVQFGATSYGFDARGRMIEKRAGASVTSYRHDVLGPLRGVTLPDGREVEYVLDPGGRRVGKKLNGAFERQWLYRDDLSPVAELAPNGALVSRFVYGESVNVPDYMVRDGIDYKLVTDALGSVRLVVNAASGEVAQRLDYDEFGRVLADTNPGFQPFGFAGGLYDPDTGLVRFGARDYDAVTGRWTSKDPLGFGAGDTNLYAYVFSDPINLVDPTGLNVGAPSFAESLIPVWGSGREAVNDFQCGRYGWAAVNAAMAVGDVFLVKALATGALKAAGRGAARGATTLESSAIRFSQSSVNGAGEIAASMAKNGWVGAPVDVVSVGGRLVTVDNTRVIAAHMTGTPVQAFVHGAGEALPASMAGRFGAATTWGEAVAARIAGQNAGYRAANPLGSWFVGVTP